MKTDERRKDEIQIVDEKNGSLLFCGVPSLSDGPPS